jgi:hypothetical protein
MGGRGIIKKQDPCQHGAAGHSKPNKIEQLIWGKTLRDKID